MENANLISRNSRMLICGLACIVLIGQSSTVANALAMEAPLPAQEQSHASDKADVNLEHDISAYFEKARNEILQGRKFSDQSTPVNALLTLISAYHHQDRNILEKIFPIVRQKQFEQLASPETRTQMLAVASKSVARSVEIKNDPPRESDTCAVYSSESPEKPADQVWSFAYVAGAWRFAGSTSATDDWRTQAEQAEAMTRTILQSESEKTKAAAGSKGDSGAAQASEKQIQLRNKLVAWWRLDEADGNDVADSSGNGHVGKLAGNPRWQPAGGKVGGALAFDGDGDFVQIADEPAFDLTGPITIAAWIKANSFDKRWQAIVTKGDTAWRLQRDAEENTLAFHCTGITSLTSRRPEGIEGKKNVNDGQWHHVVGVYDGATIVLYTDGVLDNSSKVSGSVQMNDSVVMIGGNSEQADRDWNGLVDEVCIIAGAIDANAAHALYTGTSPNTIAQTANPELQCPGKLLAWWKFENDPNDSAGANHGTIHGNPTFVDGKVGRAISLEGDDYVDYGKPGSLNFGAGDWTISAWIKTTQSGSEPVNRGTVFAYGGDETGGMRYTLAVNEEYLGTAVLTTDDDISKVQAFGKTIVNDGKWHHVVGMRNAEKLQVYVDSVLDGDVSLPASYDLSGVSQHNAYIGAITDHRDSSLFKYFIGVIDEVCIFGGAVNADGIRSLYAGENPMKVGRTAIVARSTQAQPPSRQVTGAVISGSIEGDWQVSTNPAIIQIRRKPDETLAASVVAENPDVASPTVALDEVTFENGKFHFKLTSQQAVFEGTMKEDGLTIEGQLQQQGQTKNVILRRVVAAATEAAPAALEQLQVQSRGASRIATALILVLVLGGVVAAVVFFLVRSSINR